MRDRKTSEEMCQCPPAILLRPWPGHFLLIVDWWLLHGFPRCGIHCMDVITLEGLENLCSVKSSCPGEFSQPPRGVLQQMHKKVPELQGIVKRLQAKANTDPGHYQRYVEDAQQVHANLQNFLDESEDLMPEGELMPDNEEDGTVYSNKIGTINAQKKEGTVHLKAVKNAITRLYGISVLTAFGAKEAVSGTEAVSGSEAAKD